MENPPRHLNRRHVERRFDRAAATFDRGDYVHRYAFDGLLERLEPLRVDPEWILDLGAATGTGSRALAKRFRRARVISGDLSMRMLQQARASRRLFSKGREVRMDAARLPLRDGSADLVVANMLLPWIDDLAGSLGEVNRVLDRGGVFAFATLGPGTFEPLRQVATGETRLHTFADMHDVGDAMVRAGLSDPVLDVDRLSVTWTDLDSIRRDHVASGAGNAALDRTATLTGRARLADTLERFRQGDGFAAELELVFGHAWGSGTRPGAGEFHVDANAIGRRSGR
jgi:malonyl-CoA O-methyltransferase